MNIHYRCLLECFEKWSKDASELVSGEAVLFRDFPPVPDMIFDSLAKPSEPDATACPRNDASCVLLPCSSGESIT